MSSETLLPDAHRFCSKVKTLIDAALFLTYAPVTQINQRISVALLSRMPCHRHTINENSAQDLYLEARIRRLTS